VVLLYTPASGFRAATKIIRGTCSEVFNGSDSAFAEGDQHRCNDTGDLFEGVGNAEFSSSRFDCSLVMLEKPVYCRFQVRGGFKRYREPPMLTIDGNDRKNTVNK
jgi:hypothetical protein